MSPNDYRLAARLPVLDSDANSVTTVENSVPDEPWLIRGRGQTGDFRIFKPRTSSRLGIVAQNLPGAALDTGMSS